MNTFEQQKWTEALKEIITDEPNTVRAAVATEVLEHSSDISTCFMDILRHGCSGGAVNSLIYYVDTHAFYDKHYDEIEELRTQYEDDLGSPMTIDGDLKNFFAWFAFQETARLMVDELNILL